MLTQNTWLTLLLVAVSTSAFSAPPKKNADIEKIIKEISAKRIEATIRKLVSFETRNSLSDTTSDTKGIGAARRGVRSRANSKVVTPPTAGG